MDNTLGSRLMDVCRRACCIELHLLQRYSHLSDLMYSSSRHSCRVSTPGLPDDDDEEPVPFLPFLWLRFSSGRLRSRKLWTWFVTPWQFWQVVVLCSLP